MLIDHAKIYIFGGNGGKGCQSVYRDIFNRKGSPDGGDGGDGGDVIFESTANLHTLLDFKYNQHYRAKNGKHGGSNKKFGRCAEDLIIKVPIGTILKDQETDLIIRDLAKEGERVIVAKGGAGGKGNAKLEVATEGELGTERTIILELKLVADAGLVGFPNAGKSTLVCKISKSHSKIAPYPFTTKSPKLGVVKVHDDTFVVADMPGLIEGAHEGRGLGDKFLKHIERTSVLVHVVDMMPFDESDPLENFRRIEKELKLYGNNVYNKPRVIVANKMDLPEAKDNFKIFKKEIKENIFPVSALTGEGIKELVECVYERVENEKEKD